MDASLLIGGVLGGLDGAMENKKAGFERGRIEAEEQRKNEILKQMETMKARAAERLAVITGGQNRETEEFKHKNAVELKGVEAEDKLELEKLKGGFGIKEASIRASNRAGDDGQILAAQDKLRTEYDKIKKEADDDMTDPPEPFDRWAEKNRPELYAFAYQKGKTPTSADSFVQANIDRISKFTKPGANQGKRDNYVEQTAPPQKQTAPPQKTPPPPEQQAITLPMASNDTAQGDTISQRERVTNEIDNKIRTAPASIDIGEILGIFINGLVDVTRFSISSLKQLKDMLGKVSKAEVAGNAEAFNSLRNEVESALREPYKDKVAEVGRNRIKQ